MKLYIFSLLASAILASVYAFAPVPAGGEQSPIGLAYDEVTKVVFGGASPEPGTFSTDFDAAVSAQRSATAPGTHRGLFGGIMNSVNMAKDAVNVLGNGTASSKYYLAGWERTDDPGAQMATIYKPQQHQIIYLNFAKKTYRVIDTNAQATNETAPMGHTPNAAGQSAQPGSGKLDITVSNTALGPRVIDNIPTTGYRVTFNLKESQSTGSCTNGTFQTSMVEYISRYAQPAIAAPRVAMTRAMNAHPELMTFKPGCAPTVSMHASGEARPAPDRLPLWMLVIVSAGAPTAQGQMSGGFSTLVERGNLRELGAADEKLFSIPADFTQEQ